MTGGRAGHTLWALATLSLWVVALAAASVPARPAATAGAASLLPVPPQRSTAHTTSAAGRVPVRLTLLRVGLDAAVVPVTAGADGRLAVPGDGKAAGWWEDTAPPGSRQGSTVIAGHLDTPGGAAVFAPLTRAKPGDRVIITTATATVGYRVRAVTVRRGAALPGEFISITGPPRLVLVTCTGPYRQGSGYRDRLYVDATPAPPIGKRKPSEGQGPFPKTSTSVEATPMGARKLASRLQPRVAKRSTHVRRGMAAG